MGGSACVPRSEFRGALPPKSRPEDLGLDRDEIGMGEAMNESNERPRARFTTEERHELYRLVHELESAAHDRAAALPESDGEAYDAAVRRLRAARTAFDDYVHGTEEG